MREFLTSVETDGRGAQEPHNQNSMVSRPEGEVALQRLLPLAQHRTGQSRVVARFLLGLYNSSRFPFRLIDLRVLDRAVFKDCIAVLTMRHEHAQHLYTDFAGCAQRWEQLASDWRLTDKYEAGADWRTPA